MESHKRSVAKALAWRIIAAFITALTVYMFTREGGLSLGVGVADSAIKIFVYIRAREAVEQDVLREGTGCRAGLLGLKTTVLTWPGYGRRDSHPRNAGPMPEGPGEGREVGQKPWNDTDWAQAPSDAGPCVPWQRRLGLRGRR